MGWPDRAGLDRAGGMLERWRQKREKTSDFKLQLLLQGLADQKAKKDLDDARAYDLTTYEARQKAQREASELLYTQQAAKNLIEYDRRVGEGDKEYDRRITEGEKKATDTANRNMYLPAVIAESAELFKAREKAGYPAMPEGLDRNNVISLIMQGREDAEKAETREQEAYRHAKDERAHDIGQRAVDLEQNRLARRSTVEKMEEHYKKLGYSAAEARDKTFKHFEELDLSDYERNVKKLMDAGYSEPEAKEYIARQLRGADIRNKQDVVSQILGMQLPPPEYPGIGTPGSRDLYRAYNKYVPRLPGTNIPALTQKILTARTTPEKFPRGADLLTQFDVDNVFQLFDNERMRNINPDPKKDYVAARAEVIKTVLADEFNVFSQGISQMQLMVLAGLSESNDPMETPMRYTLGTLSALSSDLNEQYRLFSWIVNARLYPEGKALAAPVLDLKDILK